MKASFFALFGLIVLLTSCKKNDANLKLETRYLLLNISDTAQVKASGPQKIEYYSSNDYVASVSETGLVTARKVGECRIVVTSGDEILGFNCIVQSSNFYIYYSQPKLFFGSSREEVKNQIGHVMFETSNAIVFYECADFVYLFDSEDRMEGVYFTEWVSDSVELLQFLNERYVEIEPLPGFDKTFINAFDKSDATIAISLHTPFYFYEWAVLYTPYKSTMNYSTDQIQSLNRISETLKKSMLLPTDERIRSLIKKRKE
jgi:hypothetical protein